LELKHALLLNAGLTASCAVTCLTATDIVVNHTAIPRLWVLGLGLMLLTYVPMLLFTASSPFAWLVRTTILLDWGFVAVAILYSVLSTTMIDPIGWLLVGTPTVLVALFAILQQRGLPQRTVAP